MQIQEELTNLQRKVLLLESVMKESMELQDFSRYPYLLSVVLTCWSLYQVNRTSAPGAYPVLTDAPC